MNENAESTNNETENISDAIENVAESNEYDSYEDGYDAEIEIDTESDDMTDESAEESVSEEETKNEPHKTEEPVEEIVQYDAEAAKSDAKKDAFNRHIDTVLKYYGFEEGSIEERAEKAAAEAEGKTVEQYRKDEEERRTAEENARIVQQISAQRVISADIAALKAQYPNMEITDIRKIPNFDLFAKARMAGFNAVQAFAAANPNYGRESAARSAKQNNLNGTKSHLRSSTPAGSSANSEITASEMRQFRDIFPNKSDKEIRELYRKVSKK